jgi:hypothetical protein
MVDARRISQDAGDGANLGHGASVNSELIVGDISPSSYLLTS